MQIQSVNAFTVFSGEVVMDQLTFFWITDFLCVFIIAAAAGVRMALLQPAAVPEADTFLLFLRCVLLLGAAVC